MPSLDFLCNDGFEAVTNFTDHCVAVAEKKGNILDSGSARAHLRNLVHIVRKGIQGPRPVNLGDQNRAQLVGALKEARLQTLLAVSELKSGQRSPVQTAPLEDGLQVYLAPNGSFVAAGNVQGNWFTGTLIRPVEERLHASLTEKAVHLSSPSGFEVETGILEASSNSWRYFWGGMKRTSILKVCNSVGEGVGGWRMYVPYP